MGERMVAAFKIATATGQEIKDMHKGMKNMHQDLKESIESMDQDLKGSIESMHHDMNQNFKDMSGRYDAISAELLNKKRTQKIRRQPSKSNTKIPRKNPPKAYQKLLQHQLTTSKRQNNINTKNNKKCSKITKFANNKKPNPHHHAPSYANDSDFYQRFY